MEISKITAANGLKIYVQHLTPAMHACVAILRPLCFLFAAQPSGCSHRQWHRKRRKRGDDSRQVSRKAFFMSLFSGRVADMNSQAFHVTVHLLIKHRFPFVSLFSTSLVWQHHKESWRMCVKIEIIWYDFFSADSESIHFELIKAKKGWNDFIFMLKPRQLLLLTLVLRCHVCSAKVFSRKWIYGASNWGVVRKLRMRAMTVKFAFIFCFGSLTRSSVSFCLFSFFAWHTFCDRNCYNQS